MTEDELVDLLEAAKFSELMHAECSTNALRVTDADGNDWPMRVCRKMVEMEEMSDAVELDACNYLIKLFERDDLDLDHRNDNQDTLAHWVVLAVTERIFLSKLLGFLNDKTTADSFWGQRNQDGFTVMELATYNDHLQAVDLLIQLHPELMQ